MGAGKILETWLALPPVTWVASRKGYTDGVGDFATDSSSFLEGTFEGAFRLLSKRSVG